MADRVVVVTAPGKLSVVAEDEAPGPFRVRTLYSGVSAGTELSFVKGTHPALHAAFDPALGLFGDPPPSPFPITRLGYMEVGEVTESSTPAVAAGTVVAMTYGH